MDKQEPKTISPQEIAGSLILIVKYLLSKWVIIFLIGLLAGVIGITYAWMKEPVYTAEIMFAYENDKGSMLGSYTSLAAQFGIDLGGGSGSAFQGDNLIGFIQTRTIIERTLLSKSKSKLLIDDYIDNHKMADKIRKLKNVQFREHDSVPDRIKDSIITSVYLTIIKQQLSIDRPDKKMGFVAIKMQDSNEEFCKNFVEKLTETIIQYYTDYKVKKAQQNFNLLKQQTDSVRNLLFGNIETIATTNDLNVNPIRQQARTTSQKTQVNATVNAALYTELLKQLGLAQVNLQKETPLIQIVDKPVLPLKKVKPGRLLTGILFAFFAGMIAVFFFVLKIIINRETAFKVSNAVSE